MTRKELSQVYYLDREITMWEKELERLKNKSRTPSQKMKKEKASKEKNKTNPTEELAVQIAEIEMIIGGKLIEIQRKRKEIYEYIKAVDDSILRQIINYRCMSLCSWKETAECIGGRNTADSVRKIFNRYFPKEKAQ